MRVRQLAKNSPETAALVVLPHATWGPRRDLLDEPEIAVGIFEGAERAVAGALGIDAGLPGLDGERRAVPHVGRVDAPADEFAVGRFDVGDDQHRLGRAGGGPMSPVPNVTDAPECGGVNWTTRSPSIGATSSSSLQPKRS